MRLINADDLPISSIDMTDVGYHVSKYGQGIPAVYLDDIKDAPTIEPERKEGKWYKPTGMMPPEYVGVYRCSECDGLAMRDWKTHKQKLTDFCPNCGADMRGEQDDSF